MSGHPRGGMSGGDRPARYRRRRRCSRERESPTGPAVRVPVLTAVPDRLGAMDSRAAVLLPAVAGDTAAQSGQGGCAHVVAPVVRGDLGRRGRCGQRGPHSYTSTLRSWAPLEPSARPADRAPLLSGVLHQQQFQPEYCGRVSFVAGGGLGRHVMTGPRTAAAGRRGGMGRTRRDRRRLSLSPDRSPGSAGRPRRICDARRSTRTPSASRRRPAGCDRWTSRAHLVYLDPYLGAAGRGRAAPPVRATHGIQYGRPRAVSRLESWNGKTHAALGGERVHRSAGGALQRGP